MTNYFRVLFYAFFSDWFLKKFDFGNDFSKSEEDWHHSTWHVFRIDWVRRYFLASGAQNLFKIQALFEIYPEKASEQQKKYSKNLLAKIRLKNWK